MTLLIQRAIGAVAHEFGVDVEDLLSHRRGAALTYRQIGYYLARHTTRATYPQIGRAFGNRDHTTIMYGVARAEQRMRADPDLMVRVLMLKRRLRREAELEREILAA